MGRAGEVRPEPEVSGFGCVMADLAGRRGFDPQGRRRPFAGGSCVIEHDGRT
jgi:hypothetical protein